MSFERLFEPIRIGSMELKNRGAMMPMATDLADRDGVVTSRQIRYYQERARGGMGLIVTEYTGVDDEDSIPSIHNLRIARDYHVSEMEKLTDAVHLYGAKIICQIHHGGATSNPAFTGRQNIAPSAVPIADGRPVPREMTLDDIRRVQGKFVEAAARCAKAGFDGVELHGAHGYLIAQFFSKYYNRRTDEYGGNVENRCRFVAEIIADIRARLGKGFPVTLRMCGDEMTPVEGFLTLEESLEVARYLEGCGIDAISISCGSARNGDANCEPFSYRTGWKAGVARAYKEALSIPVIATGTVKTPEDAERMLEQGVCDIVGLGRSALADPEFMRKARAGRVDEVRGCIGCLYCRERVLGQALPIRCAVNACAAREDELSDLRCDGNGRAVAVVGGGVAGMEAARVLALRGFAPVLFEASDRLGGALNVADRAALREKLTRLVETMGVQLERLGVEVRLNAKATPELLAELAPAGVILACGARPKVPCIPGAESVRTCTADDVLTGAAVPEGRVVVVGGGLTGLETAEELLGRGLDVSIVGRAPQLGRNVFGAILNDELKRIMPHNPHVFTGCVPVEMRLGEVVVERVETGERLCVPADWVVFALGVEPCAEEVASLAAAYPDARVIGDARKPGRVWSAMRDGYEAAFSFKG